MAERGYILAAILVGAAATALLRFLPFLLFGGKRGMPPAVRRLAIKMPPAIIAVLVVYCLKGVPGSGTGAALAALISVAGVVALHLWKRNTLLSIAGGTALYMLLLNVLH